MEISQLYVYPIKSLRGTRVKSAELVKTGLRYDRKFMLLKVVDRSKSPPELENMAVTKFTEMSLFQTSMERSHNSSETTEFQEGYFRVTFAYATESDSLGMIDIPLEPEVNNLSVLDIVMHSSPTKAYRMESRYNAWFSSNFGFEVVLAYIGQNSRPVLGNLSPAITKKKPAGVLAGLWSYAPTLGYGKAAEEEDEGITFADCASFLVVTEASLANASARLPEGEEMDVTKFRPNIVISGATEAWEEDFWAELAVYPVGSKDLDSIDIILTANCVRCTSINIDYKTGKAGIGASGQMLKKLMKDRRVDKGAKYSPVFGRYGYLGDKTSGKLTIGDEVQVMQKLSERSTFEWPGLTN